jgi:hypothetical protein
MEFKQESTENYMPEKNKSGKRKIMGFLILGGIPLLFVLYLVLGPILDILSKDINAKDMFVVSDFVNVRSDSASNSLKMGSLNYGDKVLVYEIKNNWAEVLVQDRKVFLSSDFLVDPEVFYTIEGMFGDQRMASLVKSSKYRLALYNYFVSKGFSSEVSDEIRDKYFDGDSGKEVYQILSEPKGSLYNSVVFADFDGDFTQDAAFVLSHKGSDDKILVIFSFDKKDPLKSSKVIYEGELEEAWMSIRLAKKMTSYDIYIKGVLHEKVKIPVNGLVIGSNRSKSLHDPLNLFYYDGKKFNMFKIGEN